MEQKLNALKEKFPNIHFRLIDSTNDNIFYILNFYCCEADKDIDFMLAVKNIINEYSDIDGLFSSGYLVMYRAGFFSSAIFEIDSLREIKPFHMACNDSRINKRFNKEAG